MDVAYKISLRYCKVPEFIEKSKELVLVLKRNASTDIMTLVMHGE